MEVAEPLVLVGFGGGFKLPGAEVAAIFVGVGEGLGGWGSGFCCVFG